MFDLSKMANNHWGLLLVILAVSVMFFSFGRGCRGGVEQVMTKEQVITIVKSEIAVIKKPVAIEGEKKVIPKELPQEKIVLVPSLPKVAPKTIVIPVPSFVSPAPTPFVFSSLDEAKIRVFDDGQNKIRASFAKKQERDLAYKKRKLEEWCCSLSIVYYPPHYVVGSAVLRVKPGREKEFAQEMEKHKKALEVDRLAFENQLHLQTQFYLQQLRNPSRFVMYR